MRPEIKFQLREDSFHVLVNTLLAATPPDQIKYQFQENHFLDTADCGRGNLAAHHTVLRIRLYRKIQLDVPPHPATAMSECSEQKEQTSPQAVTVDRTTTTRAEEEGEDDAAQVGVVLVRRGDAATAAGSSGGEWSPDNAAKRSVLLSSTEDGTVMGATSSMSDRDELQEANPANPTGGTGEGGTATEERNSFEALSPDTENPSSRRRDATMLVGSMTIDQTVVNVAHHHHVDPKGTITPASNGLPGSSSSGDAQGTTSESTRTKAEAEETNPTKDEEAHLSPVDEVIPHFYDIAQLTLKESCAIDRGSQISFDHTEDLPIRVALDILRRPKDLLDILDRYLETLSSLQGSTIGGLRAGSSNEMMMSVDDVTAAMSPYTAASSRFEMFSARLASKPPPCGTRLRKILGQLRDQYYVPQLIYIGGFVTYRREFPFQRLPSSTPSMKLNVDYTTFPFGEQFEVEVDGIHDLMEDVQADMEAYLTQVCQAAKIPPLSGGAGTGATSSSFASASVTAAAGGGSSFSSSLPDGRHRRSPSTSSMPSFGNKRSAYQQQPPSFFNNNNSVVGAGNSSSSQASSGRCSTVVCAEDAFSPHQHTAALGGGGAGGSPAIAAPPVGHSNNNNNTNNNALLLSADNPAFKCSTRSKFETFLHGMIAANMQCHLVQGVKVVLNGKSDLELLLRHLSDEDFVGAEAQQNYFFDGFDNELAKLHAYLRLRCTVMKDVGDSTRESFTLVLKEHQEVREGSQMEWSREMPLHDLNVVREILKNHDWLCAASPPTGTAYCSTFLPGAQQQRPYPESPSWAVVDQIAERLRELQISKLRRIGHFVTDRRRYIWSDAQCQRHHASHTFTDHDTRHTSPVFFEGVTHHEKALEFHVDISQFPAETSQHYEVEVVNVAVPVADVIAELTEKLTRMGVHHQVATQSKLDYFLFSVSAGAL